MRSETTTLTKKQRTLILIPLLVGGFIALLNETLLNVAFSKLSGSLHVAMGTVQWLATGYMLIIGILVPVTAFLMETFTTRTLYLVSMGLFFGGSLFCGFSNTFAMFLIFRMIQGAGTGMLIPIMMKTILEIFPPEKRGSAMGKCMIVILVAPAFGPTLSGLILQIASWNFLFYMMLPFAAISIVLGFFGLKYAPNTSLTKPKIDILSVFLSTIGFGGIIFGISSSESMGLNNIVIISLICGFIGLLIFCLRQFKLKQPMLELRTFKFPMFSLGLVIIMIAFTIPFSINIILPTYFQEALNISPFTAGALALPAGVVSAVITPIGGRLYDKIGVKPLIITGFSLIVIAMLFLSHLSLGTGVAVLILFHCCIFVGTSLINTPLQTNILNTLPEGYYAHGVAILNTMQQIAAAIGSSLFIGLMAAGQAHKLAGLSHISKSVQQTAVVTGVNEAFTSALILVVIALVLSLFVKREKTTSKNIVE